MGRWMVKKNSRVDDQAAFLLASDADLALVETRQFRDDEVAKIFAVPAQSLEPVLRSDLCPDLGDLWTALGLLHS